MALHFAGLGLLFLGLVWSCTSGITRLLTHHDARLSEHPGLSEHPDGQSGTVERLQALLARAVAAAAAVKEAALVAVHYRDSPVSGHALMGSSSDAVEAVPKRSLPSQVTSRAEPRANARMETDEFEDPCEEDTDEVVDSSTELDDWEDESSTAPFRGMARSKREGKRDGKGNQFSKLPAEQHEEKGGMWSGKD